MEISPTQIKNYLFSAYNSILLFANAYTTTTHSYKIGVLIFLDVFKF